MLGGMGEAILVLQAVQIDSVLYSTAPEAGQGTALSQILSSTGLGPGTADSSHLSSKPNHPLDAEVA